MNNLIGEKFGRLLVIDYSHKKGNKHYWECECDCGNIKSVRGDSLKGMKIVSCGCYHNEKSKQRLSGIKRDLMNERFGKLLVIEHMGIKNNKRFWKCKCDCGNIKIIRGCSLTTGNTVSCGCYSKELSTKRIVKVAKNNTGTSHYLYNPTLTDKERNDKRDTSENYNFRKKVFERDDYKCVSCKEHTRDLQAHHIENYKTNISKRFDVENGVTLCSKCHKKFHKIYTRYNNNLNQLIEFIKDNTEVR